MRFAENTKGTYGIFSNGHYVNSNAFWMYVSLHDKVPGTDEESSGVPCPHTVNYQGYFTSKIRIQEMDRIRLTLKIFNPDDVRGRVKRYNALRPANTAVDERLGQALHNSDTHE